VDKKVTKETIPIPPGSRRFSDSPGARKLAILKKQRIAQTPLALSRCCPAMLGGVKGREKPCLWKGVCDGTENVLTTKNR
jgi:hypothetical protein